MTSRPKQLYEFGPFVLDPAERTLLRGGDPVPLQPKVFDTLLVLVRSGGELVERDEFKRAVWPGDEFVEEQNLDKNISKLRRALGEGAGGAEYIVTVPKSGYRFAAAVRAVGGGGELVVETRTRASLVIEEVDGGSSPEDSGAAAADVAAPRRAVEERATPEIASRPPRRVGRWASAAAASVVVVLAVVAYVLYRPREARTIDSVAVLPFVNVSGDVDVEYISDGVSESLINSLSRLPELKVIARSSSFKYKGKEVDPQEVARALGVQAVVSGRVVAIDALSDPERLRELDLTVLD